MDYVVPDATVSVPAHETVHHVAQDARNASSHAHAAGATCSQQNDATWGLVRTTQQTRNLNGKYKYDSAPEDEVDVYVCPGLPTSNSPNTGNPF